MSDRPSGMLRRLLPRVLLVLFTPWLLGLVRLGVTVHVAVEHEKQVASVTWIEDFVRKANELFAPAGCRFEVKEILPLSISGAIVNTVGERDALANQAPRDGSIHLFVVKQLANKDLKGGWIAGVHWRYQGSDQKLRGRHYVIVSLDEAQLDTPAHELGHFFGEDHTRSATNLMKARPRNAACAFDSRQARRIAARLTQAIKSRALIPLKDTP